MSQAVLARGLLIAGASAAALSIATSPAAAQSRPASAHQLEDLVVTAQKREEAVQDVPIAISAFNQDTLQKAKIDGGPNLVLAVPNVNFSKSNFTSYNFQIRGIGSKLTGITGDPGIAIHLNNAPLIDNNLFESEYYDVERVEVLRGPQGTLYGRNATGGVVNLITAKPVDRFEAMGRAEYGDHNAVRARGMINIPLGEAFALRMAGAYLKRDGFGTNLANGHDVDDRDMRGLRVTLGFTPTDDFRAYLLWDHFKENDNRSRVGKQLCTKDPGPASIGGVAYSPIPALAQLERGFFSQGCRSTSLYAPGIFGTTNSQASLGGLYGAFAGFQTGDAAAGKVQNSNPHDIESLFDPIYRTTTDIYEINIDWNVARDLQLSWLGAYARNRLYSRSDYNRFLPSTTFNTTPNPFNLFAAVPGYASAIYPTLFPNGVINDPQNGPRNRFTTTDISANDSEEWSHEIRLQSAYSGPLNFNVGGLMMKHQTVTDYFVMFNTGTGYYQLQNLLFAGNPNCRSPAPCIAIDPNADPDRSGHNYYDNFQPYTLRSGAVFGELYYRMADNFKWTLGLRYTHDKKTTENHFSALNTPGVGVLPGNDATVQFKEVTGRFGFDWKPRLDFTDETLVYAFYSRGYKAGGLNPACSADRGVICPNPTFAPEFVDAYEVGAKNTLLGGAMTLNLTGFYYKYKGYQISKIVNRSALNENIDAQVKGAEVETVWRPLRGLRLNANLGYLDTEITGGESIDTLNRTQGDPGLIVVKGQAGSNCVVSLANAQLALLAANGQVPGTSPNPFAILGLCNAASSAGAGSLLPGSTAVAVGTNVFGGLISDGAPVRLKGDQLPNAPHWTVSLGAQYTWAFAGSWAATLRGDYHWQGKTYARIYNSAADRIHSWRNLNATLTLANAERDLEFGAFVKNATNENAILDAFLTDDSSGLYRNAFYTEPRTYGLFVQKHW